MISEADKWQESWDKMEETERRDIGEVSEEDAEEYRRQDAEDKGLAHLEERRRREPPIVEPLSWRDWIEATWILVGFWIALPRVLLTALT